jgi:plasmid stabilization system protein ParE
MPEPSLSGKAKRDLKDIHDYISVKLESPTAAKNMVKGIMEKVMSLRQFPDKGTPLNVPFRLPLLYRYVHYKHYMIFYRSKGDTLIIIRILYARRNYLKILFPQLFVDDTDEGEAE